MARQKQEMGEQPLSAFSLTPATTMFKYLVGGIAPIAPRDYQSQFTLSGASRTVLHHQTIKCK